MKVLCATSEAMLQKCNSNDNEENVEKNNESSASTNDNDKTNILSQADNDHVMSASL